MFRSSTLFMAAAAFIVLASASAEAQPAGPITFRGTCALVLIRPIPKCRPNWVPACFNRIQCTTRGGQRTTVCSEWRCVPRFFRNR
jgi:hypothetical protein